MKKTYIKPAVVVEEIEIENFMLTLSQGRSNTAFPDETEEYIPGILVDNNEDDDEEIEF